MVLSFFGALSAYFKPGVTTDDLVFRLHYNLTSVLLVAFAIVVSTGQFFGNPISCIPATRGEAPLNLLDNYCWSHTTFTLPKAYNRPMGWGEQELAYDGVDIRLDGDDVVYHAYYQWVCFFLFLQALLFYVTRYLWNNAYGVGLQKLFAVKDVRGFAAHLDDTFGRHWGMVVTYHLCLLLNAGNAVAQMYFTDAFLRGEFLTYGPDVLGFPALPQLNRTDPTVKVFPLVTKCKFPRYGAAGSVQMHDTLCVLPVNVINEKIFIFLWFWYAALACVSLAWIVCQLPPLLFSKCRLVALQFQKTREVKDMLRNVLPKCNAGDYFLLRVAQKNYLATDFKALLAALEHLLEVKPTPTESERPLLPETLTRTVRHRVNGNFP